MASVTAAELRNNTAGLLRRVQAEGQVVITLRGEPVAMLVPFRDARRRWLPRGELVSRLARAHADPGLREELARLAGDTTDDLKPSS
jgi:prevent-host-death family protein